MELRQVESFVAVAEDLHFSRAAARVHLSQPALSQQIKRLEQELGFELLRRNQRNVELTAAGSAFLERARQLLADADEMVAAAGRVASGKSGTLRLGYVGSALFSVVPPAVRALRTQAPDIEVTLAERKTEEQLAAMRERRLDAGFIKAPARPIDDFEVRPLLDEAVGVALPAGHRLGEGPNLALAELADEPFVIFPRAVEPDTFDTLMACCAESGFTPRIAQEATSLQTVLGLVATGLGVAFVAASVMEHSKRDGVVFLPLEPEGPRLTTALAWPVDTPNAAVQAFVQIACEALERIKQG